MADATTLAPEKKKELKITVGSTTELVIENSPEHAALLMTFDARKKYVFELAQKNLERELPDMIVERNKSRPKPHQDFQPYRNIVYTSQVIWNGQRRMIRYYDGCDTIFSDKQPKEKDVIELYNRQTKRRHFAEGKFGAFGDERMLLMYLYIASWNAESEFRTRSATEVYRPSDAAKKMSSVTSRLDKIEEAMKFAREATNTKMKIHASYLNIPMVDYDSGNDLEDKEIRALYREEAAANPEKFIESYGNKSIEIKYYISKAIESGTINNRKNPNKAVWGSNDTEICDISGLKSKEAIAEKVYEFSQLEAGEEFLLQLKALYN